MRTAMILLVSLVATTFSTSAAAQDTPFFEADLQGDAEVPPVDTDAQGFALLRFRRGGFGWRLRLDGLDDVTRAHIHCGIAGENGPIGVTLLELAQPQRLTRLEGAIFEPDIDNDCGWDTLADVYGALLAGEAYVNVHTDSAPPGELRGQVAPVFPGAP